MKFISLFIEKILKAYIEDNLLGEADRLADIFIFTLASPSGAFKK